MPDLPRAELLRRAQEALDRYPGCQVYFKFTCDHCGNRCQFDQPNRLYETGTCDACGRLTHIERGGFAVLLSLGWLRLPPRLAGGDEDERRGAEGERQHREQ